MTKNGVYPTVILRVSYGYPSVKDANYPIKWKKRAIKHFLKEGK